MIRTYLSLALFIAFLSFFSITAEDARAASAGVIPGHYIVVLNEGESPASVSKGLARSHGIIPRHIYKNALNGFSAQIQARRMSDIARDPRVSYVEPDVVVSIVKGKPPGKGGGGGGGGDTTVPAQKLPTGIDRINAELNSYANIDGVDERVDVDIAIIDTGVSNNHPDINFYRGVTVAGLGKAGGVDDNGHGSHCAGIAAGIDNNQGIVGVAPGARIWSVKVLDRKGSGALSGVIAGIDWVTGQASSIEVANMSLGFKGHSTAFDTAISNSVAAGIVYVVAASNDSADASAYSPASHPDVITVSAINDTDGKGGGLGSGSSYRGADRNGDGIDDGTDDTFAWFSNYGAAVDIAAPGVDIESAWKGDKYAVKSGTSMAAPHVTGAAALLMSVYGGSPDQIKSDLVYGGTLQLAPDGFSGDPDYNEEPLLNAE